MVKALVGMVLQMKYGRMNKSSFMQMFQQCWDYGFMHWELEGEPNPIDT